VQIKKNSAKKKRFWLHTQKDEAAQKICSIKQKKKKESEEYKAIRLPLDKQKKALEETIKCLEKHKKPASSRLSESEQGDNHKHKPQRNSHATQANNRKRMSNIETTAQIYWTKSEGKTKGNQ